MSARRESLARVIGRLPLPPTAEKPRPPRPGKPRAAVVAKPALNAPHPPAPAHPPLVSRGRPTLPIPSSPPERRSVAQSLGSIAARERHRGR
jgi:hypothetical protein